MDGQNPHQGGWRRRLIAPAQRAGILAIALLVHVPINSVFFILSLT